MSTSPTSTREAAPPRGRKTRRTIVVLSLALVLICAGAFSYVRLVLDGDTVIALILPRIEAAWGMHVSCRSADLSWPSVDTAQLIFRDVTIRGRTSVPAEGRISQVLVEINFSKLWLGCITVNAVDFVEPELTLDSDELSRFGGSSPGQVHMAPFRVHVRGGGIERGRLVITRTSTEGGALVSDVQGTLTHASEDGAARFAIRGILSADGTSGVAQVWGKLDSSPLTRGPWQGSIHVELEGCPLAAFTELAGHFRLPEPFTGGVIDLAADATGNPIRFAAHGRLSVLDAEGSKKSETEREIENPIRARFAIDRTNDGLHIDLPEATLPGLTISGAARLGKISSSDPTVALAVRSADIDLEKIAPFLPVSLVNRQDRGHLADADLHGHVKITRAAWTGTLFEMTRGFNLRGILVLDAVLDKVSGFFPGIGLPVTRASGGLRLSSDRLIFEGISLFLGNSPIVLNGSITDLKRDPQADLFVSIEAQAQDLIPIVDSSLVASRLEPWIGKISDSSGEVDVTLDVKGKLSGPAMKGKIRLKEFQCSVEGMPLPLSKVNGSIRFRPSGITLSEIEGLIGSSPATLRGTLSPEGMDVALDAKVNPSDISAVNVMPANLRIVRPVPFSLNVKGPIASPAFSATIDLKNSDVQYAWIVKKAAGAPLRIEASGVRQDHRIQIEEAYIMLGDVQIAGRAFVEPGTGAGISLNLPPRGIRTEALIPFLHPSLEVQQGGRIEGDVVLKVNATNKPSVEANLQFSHLSLRFPGFHKRTEGMDATVQLKGKTFYLTIKRARIGNSLFSGLMTTVGWEEPRLEVNLDFAQLDTQDFSAPPGSRSTVTWGEWIRSNSAIRFLARSRGTGFVKVTKGMTPQRSFSDFRAQLEGKDGRIKVNNWHVKIADGIVRGSGRFDIREETVAPLILDFQADRLRMEKMMMFDPDWIRVEGSVISDGRLEWVLNTDRAKHGIHKKGSMEVRVQDGMVNKFEILSKLFTLINLGSIVRGRLPDLVAQGLPFHSLTWQMDVFDTKWNFKNMQLSSDAARINASGIYLADQDRIDFRVDVSPLVGFDTIFSGLFGNLITRNGKLLTTTFRVRGLTRSPDVRLEPFENLKSSR